MLNVILHLIETLKSSKPDNVSYTRRERVAGVWSNELQYGVTVIK